MTGEKYEVELKTLLGSEDAAAALRSRMKELDPSCMLIAESTQLNHYFEGGNITSLADRLRDRLSSDAQEKLSLIAERGTGVSVRTREANGETRFVVKASLGSDSSENGVARVELETVMPGMSLEELDNEILAAGYRYQAKWSRAREEYSLGPIAVCLDKNAGYGYVAEFERVVDDESEVVSARAEIERLMGSLGVVELPQDRLERMFAHYNERWPEYYGTDKIFIIE